MLCMRKGVATWRSQSEGSSHWIELATFEKPLLAFEPMRRIVPTTSTRITASMTAYSAMSWPSFSCQSLRKRGSIFAPPLFDRNCTLVSGALLFHFRLRRDVRRTGGDSTHTFVGTT